jgi:hypothetical protein
MSEPTDTETEPRKFCRYCGYPEANQYEWDTIPGGEGSHLCWGECGITADEALDKERARTAAMRQLLTEIRSPFCRMTRGEICERINATLGEGAK